MPMLPFALLFIALAADKPALPDAAGKVTTEKMCGSCHGVGIFINRRESREGWNGIIEDMLRRGMKGDDDQLGEVSDYLAQQLSRATPVSRVNVNQGTAAELASGLGISESKANAMVKYREANGNFKAIDDLLKVPGMEARIVEAKRSKIDF